MSADTREPPTVETIRPARYPFIFRPVLFAAIPAGLLVAVSFFFWRPLQSVLAPYTLAIPGLAALILLVTLFRRGIRYVKTRYEVRPDRIIVETGTLFREKTVELDVENITLVEWKSPFLLRTFYDVGHITVQEAGSAAKPAHLAYLREPGELYETIGEQMSARGFSMQRKRRIQEQTPGHLGALVDLTAQQVKIFWALGLGLLSVLPDLMPLIVGEGPSLLQLFAGNYEVFSEQLGPDVFVRARLGALFLTTAFVLLAGGWLVIRYVDLVQRTYTLYDDVIDYVDGFLNETHKFIPLENLADTQVSRPVYKRLLGLSDVTLSSQGAENAIVFKSTPDGSSFAESIDELVHRAPDPGAPVADSERPETTARPPAEDEPATGERSREADLDLRPDYLRAALHSVGAGLLIVPLVLSIVVPFLFGATTETIELGPIVVASLGGAFLVGAGLIAASSLGGAVWWLVRARATDFRFDQRGAHHTFDLFSKTDKQFALERITSVSMYRNPLDWIAGTMTVRIRSIGSDEDIDFWGIDHDPEILETIRRRLGLTAPLSGKLDGDLTPAYRLVDGVKAHAPLYLVVGTVFAAGLAAVAYLDFPTHGLVPALVSAAGFASAGLQQTIRAVVQGRIRGTLFDDHLEVAGGIVRHYRHIAPLEHVKSVESRRLPLSDAGRLTFKTAGFPIAVDHLTDVAALPPRVDERLAVVGGDDGRAQMDREAPPATFEPSAATEALRYTGLLLVGIGIVVVPYAFVYYRRVDYTVEAGRLVADSGLYFDRRVTVLFNRVDHLEANRRFVHYLTGTHDIQIFTVGTRVCDLTLRSLAQSADALDLIRDRLAFDDNLP